MIGPRHLAIAAACLLTSAAAARTQPSGSSEPHFADKVGKDLRAHRVIGDPPRIDGRLDDAAWLRAEARDDFVQNEPDNMAAPRERTVLQAAYDDRAVYVAVRCFMTKPWQLTTGIGRRDNLPPSDVLRLSFDPRHDHQTAYVFETTPSGMQADYLFHDDTRQSPDFDGVWEVRTTIDADGWIAEYRIPFSQMRFPLPRQGHVVWGLNLRRDTYATGEQDRWVPTPRGAAGFVSRFGHLVFEEAFAPPKRLELLPVTVARLTDSHAESATPSFAGGLDLRVGLGTGATFAATMNPDFAQVEQDPAILNLTVFEQFFPERRPFFVEDSRVFVPNTSQVILFHSRRIGRRPERFTVRPGDTHVDQPDQTTVLGAAKVTGRASQWTYGVLSALTSAEYAEVDTPSTDTHGPRATRLARLVEPRTVYSVGRVQRDLRAGRSNVGAMATAVVREGDDDAYSAGLDHAFRWDMNRGVWTGLWAGSLAPVGGRRREGFAGLSNFSYTRKYMGVNAHFDHISPTFRNTDAGFLSTRVDKTNTNVGINVMQPDPHWFLRSVSSWVYASRSWNKDGLVFDKRAGTGMTVTFMNFASASVEYIRDFERLDDLDSRGGVPIVKPSASYLYASASTDSRKTTQLSVGGSHQRDDAGGWGYEISPSLTMRPSPALQARLGVSYQHAIDAAQWIASEDVTGDGQLDAVYGRLRRHVLGITGRMTFAFSRDMALDAYIQPFVAVGDYFDVRRLARPESFDFEAATLSYNPDFSSKSLRQNLVFRWEYTRGSTLFVVWNRSALDTSRPGEFAPVTGLFDAVRGPGTNVFVVKLNFWMGL